MNKQVALENLILLDKIFRKHEAKYWLSCGTLLGFYRENNFIGHDTDTDICLEIESLTKILLDDIINEGFSILRTFGKLNDGYEIALKRNGLKTDIFLFYKKDYWYHSVYVAAGPNKFKQINYKFEPFTLTEREYLGHKFIVPEQTEEVLIQQYGVDFRTPKVKWLYYSSPSNLIQTTNIVTEQESETELRKILK